MKRLLIILFIFFAFVVVVFAEVPNEIGYSGRLKSYKSPVNGTMQFNFKIYEKEEGGTAIWESGNQGIKLSSGIFSYTIKPDETRVDWRKKDLWLQVVVDGRELLPREKFMAQSYSLHSKAAENLSSNREIKVEIGASTAYIGIDGNKMYYKSPIDAQGEYFGVPAGTVIAFAGNNVPKGYLPCDGRELDVSRYPDLFKAIGTIYGGNGSTKFKVPDFRGMFLRGTGGNAATIGIRQEYSIKSHTHYLFTSNASHDKHYEYITKQPTFSVAYSMTGGGGFDEKYAMVYDGSNTTASCGRSSTPINVNSSEENRPANYAIHYHIKT
ncbi:MAG: phage tail protein [Endomicrobium sp.]|jgi:microcystin-dependent protein|nr:phage tail protein [Endomicrobium sp.]